MKKTHIVLVILCLIFAGSALGQFSGFSDKLKKLKQTTGLDLDDAKTVIVGYSETEERAIGEQITGNLLGAAPLLDDPAAQKYVNLVGRWVALQSDRPGLDWVFGILDDRSLNAFAAPGGLVLMTRGLYEALDSEAALAAVLAHEIVHVTEKHHLDLLRKSAAVNTGANLAGAKVSSGYATSDKVIQNLIGDGAEILARGLDKSAEYEADRAGMSLAVKAGYNPIGMADVLLALDARTAADQGGMELLLSTHPAPADRIERIDREFDDDMEKNMDLSTLEDRFSEHAIHQ